jgi:FixJ family two-component response regulator
MAESIEDTDPISGPLIFILDDDPAAAGVCRENLAARIDGTIRAFVRIGDMVADPDIERVDLFVLDVQLGEEITGFDIPDTLPARCRFAAYLFMSGYTVDQKQYDKAAGLPFFDFIAKPFIAVHLVHRVQLLLAARLKIPEDLDDRVLHLWARAPYVAVVIDADLRIRLANHQMAALLEVQTPRALVGRPWSEFLPDHAIKPFSGIHAKILAGDLSRFGEYAFDIRSQGGSIHRVKWFNSPLFAGADESEALTLSVGIPGEYQHKRRIASDLRRTWKESILLHRAAIRAIKKMPLKVDGPPACQINGGR